MWGVSLPDFSDIQKLGSQLGEVLQTAKNELDKNLDQLAQGANASDGGGDELLLTGLCLFLGEAPCSAPAACICASTLHYCTRAESSLFSASPAAPDKPSKAPSIEVSLVCACFGRPTTPIVG